MIIYNSAIIIIKVVRMFFVSSFLDLKTVAVRIIWSNKTEYEK